jgi:hypothetical protein
MDAGQTINILVRLVLGAASSFLAIMLWSRTRDTAWILVISGAILTYAGTVYSVLVFLGIGGGNIVSESIAFVVSILFAGLPSVFFIAAFTVMIVRKYRAH